MHIVYALVARDRVVLAEHTQFAGNFSTVCRILLGKIPSSSTSAATLENPERISYEYDNFKFSYLIANGLLYLTMSEKRTPQGVCFALLTELANSFEKRYGDLGQTAIALGMQEEFSLTIRSLIDKYNSTEADKLATVRQQISQIHNVMIENIDKIMMRQERIELLVEKVEDMKEQAVGFRRDARDLRDHLWWKNAKRIAMMVAAAVLVLYLIVAMNCGWNLDCGGHDKKKL